MSPHLAPWRHAHKPVCITEIHKPVLSIMSAVDAAHCGALAVSFAYSFEAAIWACLQSGRLCVQVLWEEKTVTGNTFLIAKNQKVLTDWAAWSPAASEAWPLTCLLPWKASWSSSQVDFLLTEDICRLSIRERGCLDDVGGLGGGGRLSTRLK